MSAPAPASGSLPSAVTLDGSSGEGGGQILRTALTLSLLTGRPLHMVKIRARRDKPGLRPQHLTAVASAAELGGPGTQVIGAAVGSRELTFHPAPYTPGDLQIEIGTAGSTALVLQTLHLAIALRTDRAVRVSLEGGTFNRSAPSYPFLATTWTAHMAPLGAPITLAMPRAGFYPRGGGVLDAWIEPAQLRPRILTDRGPLQRIHGEVGLAHLNRGIAERMRARAQKRLTARGLMAEIEIVDWPSLPHVLGTAIALVAECAQAPPATFVGLGERGKPAKAVADEAVDELLAFLDAPAGAVDPHSADQILLPLALAPGRSECTVTAITDHLRTNAATMAAFLDRAITIEESTTELPGRVVVA
jgi:RNA 3'-terminal phosphate cyclase (ATP)